VDAVAGAAVSIIARHPTLDSGGTFVESGPQAGPFRPPLFPMSTSTCIPTALLPVISMALLPLAASAAPQWVWSSGNPGDKDQVWARTTVELADPKGVRVLVSCDNACEVWINGEFAGRSSEWSEPAKVSAAKFLKQGKNTIAIKGSNAGGTAGLVASIAEGRRGGKVFSESGASWKLTGADPGAGWEKPDFNDSAWPAAVVRAKLGDAPWGNVFAGGGAGGGGAALAADQVQVLPGFKAELLYNVPKGDQGSWVSLTVDLKGRLIAGDQEGSLYRITLKAGAEPDVQELQTKVKQAQGLLYANNALYFVRNGGQSGLYRLRDTDGDDQFDEEVLLRKIDGGGEHGPHGVILTPNGKSLIVCGGNHTKLPMPEKSLVPKLWGEDFIIPRLWDANGHASNIYAPGGWICQTDFDGKEWTLVSAGYRNQYDIALNAHGQIFTYDSDMEWDIGSPWYRPTRVSEGSLGSEFGWKSGASNTPEYYADALPPTINLGPGSPTGVCSGLGAKFPAKYQHAIYAADWTYGTMYALHLKPGGAGYVAEKEEFVAGKPLPLTDMIIHPQDGAMYFLIGGRKTQSGLYRVSYTGSESTAPAPAPALTEDMQQRRNLEKLLASPGPDTLTKAWKEIGNPDRWTRFTARAVVELHPVAQWKEKALAETSPDGSINALLALARAGCDPYERDAAGQLRPAPQGTDAARRPSTPEQLALRDQILQAAARLNWASLSQSQQLDYLRMHSVLLARTGKLEPAAAASVRARFEPHYPAATDELNRGLCELLVFLDSPQVAAKTVTLLTTTKSDTNEIGEAKVLARNEGYAKAAADASNSRPNRQQIAYGYALRAASQGWTPELRRQYFRWFNTARKFQGGHSLRGFIENIRKDALKLVPDDMRKELEGLSEELNAPTLADLPKPKGPGRPWTIEDVLALTKDGIKGRSHENGRRTYQAALCSTCHRMGSEFGGVGPDVTGSANRYTLRDLLENIVDPSKVISDQYESTLVEKRDGSSVVGRIVKEEDGKVFVAENPLLPAQLTAIPLAEVKARTKYPVSAMPPGLLMQLNQDEVLDLVAYLLSAGNPDDKVFKP
jgi:putative heme-binding domain-containing protein